MLVKCECASNWMQLKLSHERTFPSRLARRRQCAEWRLSGRRCCQRWWRHWLHIQIGYPYRFPYPTRTLGSYYDLQICLFLSRFCKLCFAMCSVRALYTTLAGWQSKIVSHTRVARYGIWILLLVSSYHEYKKNVIVGLLKIAFKKRQDQMIRVTYIVLVL